MDKPPDILERTFDLGRRTDALCRFLRDGKLIPEIKLILAAIINSTRRNMEGTAEDEQAPDNGDGEIGQDGEEQEQSAKDLESDDGE